MPGFVKRFMLAGSIGWDKYLLPFTAILISDV